MSYETNRRLTAPRPPLATRADVDPVTAAHHPRRLRDDLLRGRDAPRALRVVGHHQPVERAQRQRHRRPGPTRRHLGRHPAAALHLAALGALRPRAPRRPTTGGPATCSSATTPSTAAATCPTTTSTRRSSTTTARSSLIQALQAHQGDTGGKDPGGFSVDARELQAEGLIVPCVKLVHRGARAARRARPAGAQQPLPVLRRRHRRDDLGASSSASARLGELLAQVGRRRRARRRRTGTSPRPSAASATRSRAGPTALRGRRLDRPGHRGQPRRARARRLPRRRRPAHASTSPAATTAPNWSASGTPSPTRAATRWRSSRRWSIRRSRRTRASSTRSR